MNFIEAKVASNNGRPVAVSADGTALPLPAGAPLQSDSEIVYGIRPEHLHLREAGAGLEAEVVVVEPTGAETLLVTRFAGIECKAVFRERHQLEPGAKSGSSLSSIRSTCSTGKRPQARQLTGRLALRHCASRPNGCPTKPSRCEFSHFARISAP